MTDSMKFGPEWLRNLSADSVNNSQGSTTSNGHGFNYVSSNQQKDIQNSATSSRNSFPEFRYGREEMLSLFDKNCCLPEILPCYKNLFVEKVQFPLAMTPCTDDELTLPNLSISATRSTWLQRSPSGFSNSTRSTIRGGLVDRGRLRGKSGYHSSYNRTNNFEEESRAINALRPDRSWNDRNGASGEISSGSLTNVEWNGSASASPRRDFSNHRNHENWRKIRSDESTAETLHADGWRSVGSGTALNSSRWGRSTSWRDEENSQVSSDSGSAHALQRSLSSSTSVVERNSNNFLNSQSKNVTIYELSDNNSKIGLFGTPGATSKTSVSVNASKKNENTISISNVDSDDLPEWATENPSNAGGTFDALGAFHGSTEFDAKNSNNKVGTGFSQPSILNHSSDKYLKADSVVNKEESENKSLQDAALDSSKNVLTNFTKPMELEIEFTSANENRSKSTADISDISDQMREVTDDMIKKLIMDDEVGDGKNNLKSDHFEPNKNDIHEHQIDIINQDQAVKNNLLAPTSIANTINEGNNSYINEPLINVSGDAGDMVPTSPQLVHNITNPRELWFYRDPQSKVQGPFTSIEMTEWFKAGYFNETLFVRRLSDLRFRALGELIKMCNGHIPFTNNHLLPPILDNYQFANNYGFAPTFSNCEDLKGNVTAAANSVSTALKSVINSVDMAHMLNIHFQMLQEQYVNHQESVIRSELSQSEYFQRLPKTEKDSIVKQRVCIPDYLSSLSALSNSLATLNPSAGDQLYNVLAECSKKEQQLSDFNNATQCHPMNLHTSLNENLVKIMGEKKSNSPGLSDMPFENLNLCPKNHKEIASKILSSEKKYMGHDSVNNHYNSSILGSEETKNVPKYSQKIISSLYPEPEINSVAQNTNLLFPKIWVSNLNDGIMKSPPIINNGNCINNQWNVEIIPGISIGEGNDDKINVSKASSLSMWNVADIEKNQINNLQSEKFEAEQKPPSPVSSSSTIEVSNNESHQKSNIQQITLTQNIPKTTGTSLIVKQEKYSNKKNSKMQSVKLVKDEMSNLKEKDFVENKKKTDKKRIDIDVSRPSIRDQDEVKLRTDRKKVANVNLQQTSVKENSMKLLKENSENRIQSSVAPWSNHGIEVFKNGPCLAEIQKAERREKRADQQRQTEQSLKTCINICLDNVESHPTWNASPVPVKSIAEIQAEEAKQLLLDQTTLHKKKEQEQSTFPVPSVSSDVNNVWLGKKVWNSSNISLWEDRKTQSSSSISTRTVPNSGTVAKNPVVLQNDAPHLTSFEEGKSSFNNSVKKNYAQITTQNNISKNSIGIKKNQKESADTKKVHNKRNLTSLQNTPAGELQSEFTNWCLKSLNSMNTIVDVPTFVSFLQDLESPFEIKDYIRMYLGESKESNEFSKQFLERRSKYRNLERAQNAHNDDMCKPAPALTPSLNDSAETKVKNKKMKKSKMTKLDSRILGFSVTAAEGRLNVGDRDYVDGP